MFLFDGFFVFFLIFFGVCRVLELDLESRWSGTCSLVLLSGGSLSLKFCIFARFLVVLLVVEFQPCSFPPWSGASFRIVWRGVSA